MIAGQSPRVQWRPNSDGVKRTVQEAMEIARVHGVSIPEDVDFFEDEDGELPDDMTARGPMVTKLAGSLVNWSDLVNGLTGKVPFLVRSDILKSDEAIVAVFGHEMYELEALRDMLNEGIGDAKWCAHIWKNIKWGWSLTITWLSKALIRSILRIPVWSWVLCLRRFSVGRSASRMSTYRVAWSPIMAICPREATFLQLAIG
jgi:hypothetical protein